MSSNTAERWWVRLGARWVARINSVQGQLQLGFQAMTGVSLASGALKYFGFEAFVPHFIVATAVGTVGYAYLFAEGGVWNQTSRDKTDMSDNYSGPTMLMDGRIEATQLAYLGYVLQAEDDLGFDELRQRLHEITDEEWAAMRDGVDITAIEGVAQ